MIPLDHKQWFNKIDYSNKGCIQKDDLKKYLMSTQNKDLSYFDTFFSEIDQNNDGSISNIEFKYYFDQKQKILWDLFSKIDKDSSKFITIEELSLCLQHFDTEITDSQIKDLFIKIDTNKDFQISFDEFVAFYLFIPLIQLNKQFNYFLDIGEYQGMPRESSQTNQIGLNMTAGAIAGIFARTLTAPLDRLKIILQASQQSVRVFNIVKQIYNQDGLKAFWRGNGTNIIKIAPEQALKFGLYEKIASSLFSKDKNKQKFYEKFISGSIAGMITCTLIYPLEAMKVKLALTQPGVYNGLQDCIFKTLKNEGVRGFYVGLMPEVLGAIPFMGISMMTYDILKRSYVQKYNQDPSVIANLLAGGFSGFCGMIIAYPLGLVRVTLQSQKLQGFQKKYNGMYDCLQKLYAEKGVKGFYKGLGPCCAKALPSIGISFWMFEFSKKRLIQFIN